MKNHFAGKIFGVFFLLACFIFPQIVSAEKNDWHEKNYNFKSIKKIVLFDTTFEAEIENEVMKKILNEFVEQFAEKNKLNVITSEQAEARSMTAENAGEFADVYVKPKITFWRDSSYMVPERTVWETKTITRKKNGKEEKISIPTPVTYPPRRVDVSEITSVFEVFDAKTGKAIFMREDVRKRENLHAQKNMFGRMCKDFFTDFAKLTH